MEVIFLGLGSNLGDRSENLVQVIRALPPNVRVLAVSPVYQTEPWGYADQPLFLNQVVQAETDLGPGKLLSSLKSLERTLGRQPTFRYGPRLIDIDILFYAQRIITQKKLTIPHPHLHERPFVLVPLADLAPGFFHPGLGKTVAELLAQISPMGVSVFA